MNKKNKGFTLVELLVVCLYRYWINVRRDANEQVFCFKVDVMLIAMVTKGFRKKFYFQNMIMKKLKVMAIIQPKVEVIQNEDFK